MKHTMVWVLMLCLLLWGCAEEAPEITTEPTQHQTEATEYVEPTGLYDPDSEIEAQTGGAVKAYPLGLSDCNGLTAMGADMVVFTGAETTTVLKLSGANLSITATAETGLLLPVGAVSTQATQKGVSYFDWMSKEMVFLDTNLKEISRFAVPEGMTGSPLMSADRKTMYYCTQDSIRALNLEDGISRLLKQISNPRQSVETLLMNETVLQCNVMEEQEENAVRSTLFISTENGETLVQRDHALTVTTHEESYYTIVPEGAMQAIVYGQADWNKLLLPEQIRPLNQWYLERQHAVVLLNEDENGVAVLDYYDLESGQRTATLKLDHVYPDSVTVGAQEGKVYILGRDNGVYAIYLWDPTMTPSGDTTVYAGPRYTLEQPDAEGLKRCAELARQIGEAHDVEVLVGIDAAAVQTGDYILEAEYQVPMILRELESLDKMLDCYPKDFLSIAARGTDSGVVRICLVRSIAGTPESGNPADMDGTSFWIDENAYAAIAVGSTTELSFHHTMFHVLETRIMSRSKYCYEWETHNPEGFAYDYDYTSYRNREDTQYIEGEDRAFIDMFSMTFPREDRATIMAYAVTEGNAEYFQSGIMQEKLMAICRGIRKAFGLERSKETYIWEQYLNEPLT